MNKKVLIIHDSEIVRKGLSSIIRNFFNFDITTVDDFSNLSGMKDISNTLLLVFSNDYQINEVISGLRKYVNQNNVKIISIETKSIANNNCADYSISLKSGAVEIRNLITEIIRSTELSESEAEENQELSTREKDVLKLVAMGLSNKDIAEQLFISVHTVMSHRKNITEKLGIKSISGLTVYAIINKIIDTDKISPEELI